MSKFPQRWISKTPTYIHTHTYRHTDRTHCIHHKYSTRVSIFLSFFFTCFLWIRVVFFSKITTLIRKLYIYYSYCLYKKICCSILSVLKFLLVFSITGVFFIRFRVCMYWSIHWFTWFCILYLVLVAIVICFV